MGSGQRRPTDTVTAVCAASTMGVILAVLLHLTSLEPALAVDPPSTYAPAESIGRQIQYFHDRLTKALAQPDQYDEQQQEQVQRDADTVAVLAAVLSEHDQPHPSRKGAVSLMKRAQQLAESASDWETAQKLSETLMTATEDSQGKVDWTEVADVYRLMYQVPVVFNEVRRGASSRRFKRSAQRTADLAATLSALAQVSHFSRDYSDDDQAYAQWKEMCMEMRDAAIEIRLAAENNDQDKAKAEVKRVDRSCNDCHKRFRD